MTQSVNDTLLQEEGAIECTVAAGRSVISLHEPITMSARDQASSVLATVLIAARPVTLDVTGAAEKIPLHGPSSQQQCMHARKQEFPSLWWGHRRTSAQHKRPSSHRQRKGVRGVQAADTLSLMV